MTKPWNPHKPACRPDEAYEGCRTVGDNARDAESALKEYTDFKMDARLDEFHVSDMIANCLHLCDQYGFDADDVIERARYHWEEER